MAATVMCKSTILMGIFGRSWVNALKRWNIVLQPKLGQDLPGIDDFDGFGQSVDLSSDGKSTHHPARVAMSISTPLVRMEFGH